MPITTSSFSHVRLTVTDIARSRAFYEDLFAWPVAFEVPTDAGPATRERLAFLFGGVLYRLGDGTLLGLRPSATGSFDEDHVGLDHLSFAVASRHDLDRAAALLDQRGVTHEPVKDVGHGCILQFRDPD
ncbi:MAG: VOC family protein, partial [Acidimicrobiales bacterium]